MSFTATVTGFILLSIAITVGMIWLPRAIQTFSYADPKLRGSFLIWAIYAVGLSAKKIGGWRGKRIMVLSVLGFVIAICSVTLVNLFFSGFHKFY
jgi:ABC-type transport system involved in cytochrome c biogenesis permease subunit